jgi:hypothetical protein
MPIDMERIDRMAQDSENELTGLYNKLPSEIKERLDRLKHTTVAAPESMEAITDEDKRKILDDVDKFFRREGGGGQR